jgi:tRNA-dihydrouridine synthase C
MLGRGIVSYPGLAHAIAKSSNARDTESESEWDTLKPHIAEFWRLVRNTLERKQQAGRLKQWLNFLRRRYPQAQVAYDALKAVNDVAVIDAWVAGLTPQGPVTTSS